MALQVEELSLLVGKFPVECSILRVQKKEDAANTREAAIINNLFIVFCEYNTSIDIMIFLIYFSQQIPAKVEYAHIAPLKLQIDDLSVMIVQVTVLNNQRVARYVKKSI